MTTFVQDTAAQQAAEDDSTTEADEDYATSVEDEVTEEMEGTNPDASVSDEVDQESYEPTESYSDDDVDVDVGDDG